jgi:hypothetical protein
MFDQLLHFAICHVLPIVALGQLSHFTVGTFDHLPHLSVFFIVSYYLFCLPTQRFCLKALIRNMESSNVCGQ